MIKIQVYTILTVKPIHDRRTQQTKMARFGKDFEGDQGMKDMHKNVIINHRRMCEGFKQRFCALCYPCWGRENHWKDLNFDCDDIKGVTLIRKYFPRKST